MIQIPLLNPVRFINLNKINAGFDGDFSLFQFKSNTVSKCYFQKWEQGDTLRLQILTKDTPTDLQFRNKYDQAIYSIPWVKSNRIIQGFPDVQIWEIENSFNGISIGNYSLYFECDGENFESEPISVDVKQTGTLLLRYKNSENNYDTIFDTGVEFEFRVEADIRNFTPKNDREVYNDQIRNATQLSSVAYREFTLFVGYQRGVPDWVLDKVNQISQCDQVSYDGIYYQPTADADYEPITIDQYFFSGMTINIQPTNNEFAKYVTIPFNPDQQYNNVQKTSVFNNGSGNQSISGVFKFLSLLEQIIIIKSGANFIVNFGTTPGGNDIGTFNINDPVNSSLINFQFTGNTNLYISGSGLNYDIMYLIWKQLDEPPVPINGGGQSEPPLEVGAGVFFFEKQQGDLALQFDLATGLGLQNGGWRDWAIADGRNGTPDMRNMLPIGWDGEDAQDIGTETGSNSLTIGKANLPAEGLAMFTDTYVTSPVYPAGKQVLAAIRDQGSQDYNYQIAQGAGDPTKGVTEKMGSGTPLPFKPLSRVSVYVIKIA